MGRQPWYKFLSRPENAGKTETGAADETGHAAGRYGGQLDNPISRSDDDVLGRSAIVSSFVEYTISLNAEQGVVVGIIGPWGSGKTSFINLAKNEFDRLDVPVLDFNPWMFSGTEQLVDAFFKELAAQLRLKPELASLAERLEDYGDVFAKLSWLPIVGSWAERGKQLSAMVAKILKAKKQGIGQHRLRLEQALKALTKPIVVVLDDIDRLSRTEIRDVFKLVRLTAKFPNIVWWVCA